MPFQWYNGLSFLRQRLAFLRALRRLSTNQADVVLFLYRLFLSFPPTPLFPTLFLASFLLFRRVFWTLMQRAGRVL